MKRKLHIHISESKGKKLAPIFYKDVNLETGEQLEVFVNSPERCIITVAIIKNLEKGDGNE